MDTTLHDHLTRTPYRGGRAVFEGSPRKGVTRCLKVSQNGWKSFVECKGRWLDCETYKSSRTKVGLMIRWFRMEGPSQRIKSYPGDNRPAPKSSHDREASHRCRLIASWAEVVRGLGCSPISGTRAGFRTSRQFGPYPSRALEI